MQTEITLEQLAQKVHSMRKAQIFYFRTRSKSALKESIQHEKNVDDLIKSIIHKQPQIIQQNLFTEKI